MVYTIVQAARVTSASESMIRDHIITGELKSRKISNRRYIDQKDLKAWYKKHHKKIGCKISGF